MNRIFPSNGNGHHRAPVTVEPSTEPTTTTTTMPLGEAYGRLIAWAFRSFQKHANAARVELGLSVKEYDFYRQYPASLPPNLARIIVGQLRRFAGFPSTKLEDAGIAQRAADNLAYLTDYLTTWAFVTTAAPIARDAGLDVHDFAEAALNAHPTDFLRIRSLLGQYPVDDNARPFYGTEGSKHVEDEIRALVQRVTSPPASHSSARSRRMARRNMGAA